MDHYMHTDVGEELGELINQLSELAGCDYGDTIGFYLAVGLAFAARLYCRPDVGEVAGSHMAAIARRNALLPTALKLQYPQA